MPEKYARRVFHGDHVKSILAGRRGRVDIPFRWKLNDFSWDRDDPF